MELTYPYWEIRTFRSGSIAQLLSGWRFDTAERARDAFQHMAYPNKRLVVVDRDATYVIAEESD